MIVAFVSVVAVVALGGAPALLEGLRGADPVPEAQGDTVVLGLTLEQPQDPSAGDPAVWLHPGDPAGSLVIGASDGAGQLTVFDLHGGVLQSLEKTAPTDTAVRDGFELDGRSVPLVVTADGDALVVYRLNRDARRMVALDITGPAPATVKGVCLFRSPTGTGLHAFVFDSDGRIEQWRLSGHGPRAVRALPVRTLTLAHPVRGCAADDRGGALFVSEETVGVWRFPAEAGDEAPPVLIDAMGPGGLVADADSLAVVDVGDAAGYVVASSEGDETFSIYRRGDGNPLVGRFPADRRVDGCHDAQGIEAESRPVGASFPGGLFVCRRAGSPNGLRLVPLESILRLVSP